MLLTSTANIFSNIFRFKLHFRTWNSFKCVFRTIDNSVHGFKTQVAEQCVPCMVDVSKKSRIKGMPWSSSYNLCWILHSEDKKLRIVIVRIIAYHSFWAERRWWKCMIVIASGVKLNRTYFDVQKLCCSFINLLSD